MNLDRIINHDFLSEEELINKSSKIKSLNSLKFKIDKLSTETEDSRILSRIVSINMLLEDAYKIDMYKFQFKVFIFSLSKEIKNLEDFVGSSQ